MATPQSPGRPLAVRPKMESTRASSSYLTDLEQYRPPLPRVPPPQTHPGIDTVVKEETPRSPVKVFNGIGSTESIVIESGLDYCFAHTNCTPPVGQRTNRLIVTLFYKRGGTHSLKSPVSPVPSIISAHHPLGVGGSPVAEQIPQNLAPTDSLAAFPLEPPADSEPDQLDHLYGSFISPFCITSFLSLMATFPLPPGEIAPHSSHRCLDDPDHPRVVELTLDPAPSNDYLSLDDLRRHELIYRFEREWNVDVVLQQDSPWRRYPRLVVFDMDSTLITQEVINMLATHIKDPPDLAHRVAEITRRTMSGELEFDAAFRERLLLLSGLPVSVLTDLRSSLSITPGVRDLICALRRLGIKTAVLSGGFQPLTKWLASELGIDHAHANQVIVDSKGCLTGQVDGPIVGRLRKAELLLEIAAAERVAICQTIAVGDGANDLGMMAIAGLSVAWHAKPMVQLEADARLNGESMLDLLHFFGLTSEEIALLLEDS